MYTMRVIHMWILIVFNPSKRKATWISTKKASFTDYVVNKIMSCRNDQPLVEKCNIWRARCIIQQLVPLCISHSHVSYARIFFFALSHVSFFTFRKIFMSTISLKKSLSKALLWHRLIISIAAESIIFFRMMRESISSVLFSCES